MITGTRSIPVLRDAYDGVLCREERNIPAEAPVAIEINGIAYAVMMATPDDLDDFVTGFLLSEGLADIAEIGPVDCHPIMDGAGVVARVTLPAHRAAPIMDRARRRLGDSSCGMCGIESVEAALRPLPVMRARPIAAPGAIRAGLTAMSAGQTLGHASAATHAAAFCTMDGALVALREDVGRHNALDKLVGALARAGRNAGDGFIVMTSRCSYELIEKVARAGCPLLVTISAPTDLAVRRAHMAGLALAVVARDDSMLWVSGPIMENVVGL